MEGNPIVLEVEESEKKIGKLNKDLEVNGLYINMTQ